MNKKSINQNQLLNNSTMFNQSVEKINQILINVFFYMWMFQNDNQCIDVIYYRMNSIIPINQKQLSINHSITQCIQWHAVN